MDDRDVEWSDLAEIDKRWMDHGRRIQLLEAAVVGLVAPPEAAPERDAAAIESWEDGYKAGYKQASADKDSLAEAAPERATRVWRDKCRQCGRSDAYHTMAGYDRETEREYSYDDRDGHEFVSIDAPPQPSAVQGEERTALFRPVASGSWIYGDRLIPGGCACTFSGGFEHFTWTPSAMCPIYGHVASSSPPSAVQGEERTAVIPWYRLEAGRDGLLLVSQDDESIDLSDEEGLAILVEKLNLALSSSTALAGLKQLLRDMDMQAEKLTDKDGIITGYKFNTGAWHRLLGVLAGAELPAYIRQEFASSSPTATAQRGEVGAAFDALREITGIADIGPASWRCDCGHANVTRTCINCGMKPPPYDAALYVKPDPLPAQTEPGERTIPEPYASMLEDLHQIRRESENRAYRMGFHDASQPAPTPPSPAPECAHD